MRTTRLSTTDCRIVPKYQLKEVGKSIVPYFLRYFKEEFMNTWGTPAERRQNEQDMLTLFRQLPWKEQLRLVGRLQVVVESIPVPAEPVRQTECKIIPLYK